MRFLAYIFVASELFHHCGPATVALTFFPNGARCYEMRD